MEAKNLQKGISPKFGEKLIVESPDGDVVIGSVGIYAGFYTYCFSVSFKNERGVKIERDFSNKTFKGLGVGRGYKILGYSSID